MALGPGSIRHDLPFCQLVATNAEPRRCRQRKTTVTQFGISKKPRMKDSARSPTWFKRGGKGEVSPFPPPEGEAQVEHVRQVKHTGLDTERKT